MKEKFFNYSKFLVLLLIFPLLFCFTACGKSNEDEYYKFNHDKTKITNKYNNMYNYIQVKEIKLYDTSGTYLYFKIEVEPLNPNDLNSHSPYSIDLYSFDFYFTEPQTVLDFFIYDTNEEKKVYSISVKQNMKNIIYVAVKFRVIDNFNLEDEHYVLKYDGVRI